MSRKFHYLTYTDRLIIEKMSRRGAGVRTIAIFLDVAPSTISRELRRGRCEQLDTELRTIWIYAADKAQRDADFRQTAKGRPLAIGSNHALAQHIEREILSGRSPDVVISELKRNGQRPFSTVTLYRYIDKGVFLGITNRNLLEKCRRKRKYHHITPKRPPAGTSIERRPIEIWKRNTFGHWEMDCVIGKSTGKAEALLVLTERKTRFELVVKLRDKTAHSVVSSLDKLTSKYNFRKIFKSITVDNGSEFSDFRGMEYDKDGTRRTSVYYCHPYTSCERGSNERMNRMIRRFFPKGQSLAKVTQKQCDDIAAWLNDYPRRILDYATPRELFERELQCLV